MHLLEKGLEVVRIAVKFRWVCAVENCRVFSLILLVENVNMENYEWKLYSIRSYSNVIWIIQKKAHLWRLNARVMSIYNEHRLWFKEFWCFL